MDKKTSKLVVIITLICCTIALLTCGIVIAYKALQDDAPGYSSSQDEDGDWTQNY